VSVDFTSSTASVGEGDGTVTLMVTNTGGGSATISKF